MTKRAFLLSILAFLIIWTAAGQLQQSGGPGSSVTANAGTNLNTSALALESGGNLATLASTVASAKVNVTGTITAVTAITNALPAGANILGYVRVIPPGCSAQSTPQQLTVSQVATGAGSSLTSTTSCVISCYANNITNSAATLRLADKAGTPVIWLGGNADFSIPANSNIKLPLAEGIVFTSGITAIAGTSSALNVGCSTYQ